MNRFVCKNCGMITDKPKIVPHPDKDKEYRELFKEYEDCWQHPPASAGHFFELGLARYEGRLKGKYNYSITCPVCLGETRFWREEPFPTDKPLRPITIEIPGRLCNDCKCEWSLIVNHKNYPNGAIDFCSSCGYRPEPFPADKEDNIDLENIPTRVV